MANQFRGGYGQTTNADYESYESHETGAPKARRLPGRFDVGIEPEAEWVGEGENGEQEAWSGESESYYGEQEAWSGEGEYGQGEYGQGEYGEAESEADYESETEDEEEAEAVFDEMQEMELASELLGVNNQRDLNRFISKLIRTAGRIAGGGISAAVGQALGSMLKATAVRSLPMFGNEAEASEGEQIYGLELEGMSGQDQEFEKARRYVRLGGASGGRAARAPRRMNPRSVAMRSLRSAARRFAPGLIKRLFRGRGYGRRPGGPFGPGRRYPFRPGMPGQLLSLSLSVSAGCSTAAAWSRGRAGRSAAERWRATGASGRRRPCPWVYAFADGHRRRRSGRRSGPCTAERAMVPSGPAVDHPHVIAIRNERSLQKMHDLDRTQMDRMQYEMDMEGFEYEDSEYGRGLPGGTYEGPFSEAELNELATELLSVQSEQELDMFITDVFKRATRAIGKFAKTRAGGALRGILGNAIKTALPIIGGAIIPGAGMIAGKAISDALEMEGVPAESRDLEAAKKAVDLTGKAAQQVASLPPDAPPQSAIDAVNNVVQQGPDAGAPPDASPVGGSSSGRWYREGRRIVVVGL